MEKIKIPYKLEKQNQMFLVSFYFMESFWKSGLAVFSGDQYY